MSGDLADLYQEVILEHSRRPRHGKRLECYDANSHGDNPMCGDKIRLFIRHAPDGTIAEAGFEARGCAISIASADLMAQVLPGLSDDEARRLFASFRELARTGSAPESDETSSAADGATNGSSALETLQPLAGVHAYPSRVKCATLPWHALMAALENSKEVSSE